MSGSTDNISANPENSKRAYELFGKRFFNDQNQNNPSATITPEPIEWLKRMQGNAVQPMYNQGLLNTANMPQSYGNNVQSMFQGYKGE